MKLRFIKSPLFNNAAEGAEFDRKIIAANPKCQQYLRVCSQGEIPKWRYDLHKGVAGVKENFFKLVFQISPGIWRSKLWTTWDVKSPKKYCEYLEGLPSFAEILKIHRECYGLN
jgi:hypothetical protein